MHGESLSARLTALPGLTVIRRSREIRECILFETLWQLGNYARHFFRMYLAGFRSRRFLDGVRVGILRVLGVRVGVGIFDPTPTPKVQLN